MDIQGYLKFIDDEDANENIIYGDTENNSNNKLLKILGNDKLVAFLFVLLLIFSSITVLGVVGSEEYIEKPDIISSPTIDMTVAETDNGINVKVGKAGDEIQYILVKYNNGEDTRIYTPAEEIKMSNGDGNYKIYYITENNNMKLYEEYIRRNLSQEERFI